MKIQNSNAWKAAEWEYAAIHAERRMPFLGEPPSPDDVTKRLARIVRACPSFYPAVLELGLRKLAAGAKGAEEKRILKGLQLLLDLGEPEHIEEELESLIDNLENVWRYDVAKECLELLVERFPQQARYRDYLAHAIAKLGDVETALDQSRQAVRMEPDNPFFRCNLGLFFLMAGNANEAQKHLNASLRLDPDNETTQGNLAVLEYISKHGGNFFDFLLRPLDEDEIERLSEEDDVEELDRLSGVYNQDRLVAFGQWMASQGDQRVRCGDTIATLKCFFDFVDRVANLAGLLHENIAFLTEHFVAIMHKFIFKFGDVDREMIAEVCESLLKYYGFLAERRRVSADDLNRFHELVRSQKAVLIEKTERYNAIRHDDALDEEEKETIREELFAGDHSWPHL